MIVIAHRGSSKKAPENTLPAFRRAIQDKADALEIDVQLTKDRQVVVIHDEWLNRTTNGQGFVCDVSYEYIRRLDAGSWFQAQFKGTQVPALEEVLLLAKEHDMPLHIELKNNFVPQPGIEEKVIRLIHDYQLEERVILSSFRLDSLKICRELAPHIRRGYLCWNILQLFNEERAWESLELHSLHPHVSMVSSLLMSLQQKGYSIYPYVIERKSELSRCIQHQVDGVFTNYPGKVKKIISAG